MGIETSPGNWLGQWLNAIRRFFSGLLGRRPPEPPLWKRILRR